MKLTNKGQLELFFLKLKLKKQNEILIYLRASGVQTRLWACENIFKGKSLPNALPSIMWSHTLQLVGSTFLQLTNHNHTPAIAWQRKNNRSQTVSDGKFELREPSITY